MSELYPVLDEELMSNAEFGDVCGGLGAGATLGGAIAGPPGAVVGAIVDVVISYEVGKHNQLP